MMTLDFESLKNLKINRGSENPLLFILDINDNDSINHGVPIKNTFVDKDGDIILQIDKKMFR